MTQLATHPDLPWDAWAREERDRAAHQRAHTERLIRPSIDLPADLIARTDRVAAMYGMTRSQYVTAALVHYQAHWRPCPAVGS